MSRTGLRRRAVSKGGGAALVGLVLVLAPRPGGPALPEQEPSRHLERARSQIRAGDLPGARSSLETFVDRAPERADGWLTLGLVHFALGGFDEAARALGRSLELDAAQPHAHKMLGRVHTARGRPALAERSFAAAARLDAEDPEARYLLGRLYQSEGRLVEAARFLEAAATLDPGSARALAFLGSVHYALGDAARAEELLRRAVRVTEAAPEPEPVPHLELGVFLQRTNRLDESVAALRHAVELDAGNAGAHFELGRSLHRLGRLEEAATALQAALAVDDTDARVHYLLGRVCYERGERECGDRHMLLSERHRGR